jgi:hypothetical protein
MILWTAREFRSFEREGMADRFLPVLRAVDRERQ